MGVASWVSDDDLLSHGQSAISSAHFRFTVLFGMGRGGTEMLWSSDVTCIFSEVLRSKGGRSIWVLWVATVLRVWFSVPRAVQGVFHLSRFTLHIHLQGYRVKPHGQLVLVSLTHCCASTPSLSTSWSRTTLPGDRVPGKSYLKASFPLRCFQRLSLPNLATRRCHWRDNRYTRDSSTPVLSY